MDRLKEIAGKPIEIFKLTPGKGEAAPTPNKKGEGCRYSRKSQVLVQHAVLLRVKVSFILRCLRPAPRAEVPLDFRRRHAALRHRGPRPAHRSRRRAVPPGTRPVPARPARPRSRPGAPARAARRRGHRGTSPASAPRAAAR